MQHLKMRCSYAVRGITVILDIRMGEGTVAPSGVVNLSASYLLILPPMLYRK